MPKLNIGCGADIVKDWINADLYYEHSDVVKADILALPEEWTNHFEEVFCRHVLEHVGIRDVPVALANLHRVLQPNGKCVISVPDLDYCCEIFHSCREGTLLKAWALRTLYGLQDHPGEFHKSGFTETSIKAALKAAGFEIQVFTTIWSADQKTLAIQCTKK